MTPLKVKKLHANAVLPTAATEGSAGLDLVAVSEQVSFVKNIATITYDTGIAVEIPPGYVGLLFPRSSIVKDKTLILGNAVGVLDSDFRGSISFVFKDMATTSGKKYAVGDRIGQLVIVPYVQTKVEEVQELSETKRGLGGYGSSGK